MTLAARYRAFLSYSHKDVAWGKWLQRALESYRVDRDLVGRDTPVGKIPPNLRPVFVDRDDFAGGYSLTAATLDAIEASQFLVVICSPAAAASHYVNEEIRLFKVAGGASRIIPIIVDGEPGDPTAECFPAALKFEIGPDGQVTTIPSDPIAADARDHADGREIAKQKVVAGLLGIGLDEIRKRAIRAQRRRFIALASTAAAMTVLAVVAVIAAWIARSRTMEAEQRLNWALETAGGITSKVATFKNKFGVPAPMLADLLGEVEQLLNRLSQQGVKSPDLVMREAVLLGELSDGNFDIGDTTHALANAKQASEKYERMVHENGASLPLKNSLAWSYLKSGHILSRQNLNHEAHLKFVAAEEIFRSLVAAEPINPAWRSGLAGALTELASSFALQGDSQREGAAINEQIAIRRELASIRPNDPFYTSTLAEALNNGGMKAINSDDIVGAEAMLKEALDINLKLALTDPTNSHWADNIATNQINLGYCLDRAGDTNGAIGYYLTARETLKRISVADPTNVIKMGSYAFASQRLAASYSEAGRSADAAAMLEELVETRRKILTLDPFDASQKINLTISLVQLAKSRWDTGDPATTLSISEEASRLGADLIRADPNNVAAKTNRIVSLEMIALVKEAKGDEPGSIAASEEEAALSAEVAAQDPKNTLKASAAAFARMMVATKYRKQGKPAEAMEILNAIAPLVEQPEVAKDSFWLSFRSHLYEQKYLTFWDMNQMDQALAAAEQCLQEAKRWSELDKGSALAKQRLANGYTIVGNAERRLNRLDEAKQALRSGLDIRKALVEADSRDITTKADLAVSWSQLFSLAWDQQDYSGALMDAQQALALGRELVKADPSNLAYQTSLAESYSGAGSALRQLNRTYEAREAFQKELEIRQSLAAGEPGREDLQDDLKWTLERLSGLPPVETDTGAASSAPVSNEIMIRFNLPESRASRR